MSYRNFLMFYWVKCLLSGQGLTRLNTTNYIEL